MDLQYLIKIPFIVKLITLYNVYVLFLKFSFPPSLHCPSISLTGLSFFFWFLPLCLQYIYLALFYCIFAKPQLSVGLLLIWLWFLITSFWTSITDILEILLLFCISLTSASFPTVLVFVVVVPIHYSYQLICKFILLHLMCC